MTAARDNSGVRSTPPARDTAAATRLAPGQQAPGFALHTDTGAILRLADLRGRRLVLYAFPAAMTPGCTTEACDFRDSLAALRAAGLEVVGIAPDPAQRLAKFRAAHGLTFPLVRDPDHAVLTAYGAYGEKKNYGRIVQGVIRSTFVIDPTGRIEHAYYHVKATGHVARLRRDLGL